MDYTAKNLRQCPKPHGRGDFPYSMTTKNALITAYKAQLSARPDKVREMVEDNWYGSLLGLVSRIYLGGFITLEEANQELR